MNSKHQEDWQLKRKRKSLILIVFSETSDLCLSTNNILFREEDYLIISWSNTHKSFKNLLLKPSSYNTDCRHNTCVQQVAEYSYVNITRQKAEIHYVGLFFAQTRNHLHKRVNIWSCPNKTLNNNYVLPSISKLATKNCLFVSSLTFL